MIAAGTIAATGGATINGGQLAAGAANAFSTTTPVTISGGGLLDITAGSQTIKSLTIDAVQRAEPVHPVPLERQQCGHLNGTIDVTGAVLSGGTIDLMNYASNPATANSRIPFFPPFPAWYTPRTSSSRLPPPACPSGKRARHLEHGRELGKQLGARRRGCPGHCRHGHDDSGSDHARHRANRGQLDLYKHQQQHHGLYAEPRREWLAVMQNTGGTGSQIAVTSGVHAIAANIEISGGSLTVLESTGGSLGRLAATSRTTTASISDAHRRRQRHWVWAAPTATAARRTCWPAT